MEASHGSLKLVTDMLEIIFSSPIARKLSDEYSESVYISSGYCGYCNSTNGVSLLLIKVIGQYICIC